MGQLKRVFGKALIKIVFLRHLKIILWILQKFSVADNCVSLGTFGNVERYFVHTREAGTGM